MNKIIVPTDFSFASKNALEYALQIAPLMGVDVEIVHIYSSSFNTDQPHIRTDLSRRESALKDLQAFSNLDLAGDTLVQQKVTVTHRAISGMPKSELVELSKDDETRLIIMGKTGDGASTNRLFGSIAKEVATEAHCPVLLISSEDHFSDVKNVLYASDYIAIDEPTLQRAVDFASLFKATMHFVHIKEDDLDEYADVIEDKIFQFLFKDKDPDYAFNLVSVKYPDIVEGLNQYIEENKVDMMILVSERRSFLSRLFLKSVTEEMVHYGKASVLVFHKE